MADETTKPGDSANRTEKSYKAATHGGDNVPHTHPGHAEVSREEIGRKSDEHWKEEKKFEEDTKLDEVDREAPM